MATPARYRRIRLGEKRIEVKSHDNGCLYVNHPDPLDAYPQRLTDRLLHWAQTAPDRSYMAMRDNGGDWRHISYAQALKYARSIGQALLDRKLSAERPVVILSGNDLEHAMLALACQFAGVPHAPISPAYSLVSKDYDKLRHVFELLTPGLVFVADAQAFRPALDAVMPDGVELVATRTDGAGRPE